MHQIHTNSNHVNDTNFLTCSRLVRPGPSNIQLQDQPARLLASWSDWSLLASHTHTQNRMSTHTVLSMEWNRNLPRSEDRLCRDHGQGSDKCTDLQLVYMRLLSIIAPLLLFFLPFLTFCPSPKQPIPSFSHSHNPLKHPIRIFTYSQ